MKCFRCVCPNSGVGLANSFQLYLTVLGHTNLIFSLTDPTDPNFSKKISHTHAHTPTHPPTHTHTHTHQICLTLNIHSSSNNKKETIIDALCEQVFKRWKKQGRDRKNCLLSHS